LPNKADQELLDFLEEEAIIQGYDHEGFQYLMRNNSHLHQMKDDRNNWQEGLVPKQETRQMKMHKFKIFLEDEHF
jgi:hypothetical protein